jgi:hypothetical protein
MKNIVKKPLEKSKKISRNQNLKNLQHIKISITHTHFIWFFETIFGSLSI